LKAAGAIVLGKTNTPEFALSGRTVNRLGPECVNPWNTACTTAGSSGGSGAAVAAGMGALSIGTDGGGSIRWPSAFNGVFGMVTGAGRVSKRGDRESARIVQHVSRRGPMTRSVRDAALIMNAIAGWDPLDLSSSRNPAPDYVARLDAGVRGMRLAWLTLPPDIVRAEGVESKIRKAAATFESLGATIEEIDFDFEGGLAAAAVMTGASQQRIRALANDSETRSLLSPYILEMVAAPAPTHAEEMTGWQLRRELIARLEQAFQRFDLLLMPTTCFGAPRRPDDPWAMFMPYQHYITGGIFINVTGACAASVPCGFVDGLPIGLQIVGGRHDEDKVLQVSYAFEQTRPWASERPPL
jgi:Asp-tRNA(Asn)/Glu-tRNA(Gln) amidotransferase A subunit family amidase